MRDLHPLVLAFSHEKQRPREKDALLTLQKIASLVKPIMRARNWKVGTLAEFYPDQHNLLGVNYSKGTKICLRLRYPGDATQFLPMEQVVDTMLHELSHNVFGPHDEKFHALWDQLREEYEALLRKGYTGEGFLSDGKRLGGRHVPQGEVKRMVRAAAEKRQQQNALGAGSGRKLGGAPLRVGQDIRRVIVDAIERRTKIEKGCGATNYNDEEIKKFADAATKNGFRTQAEEDKANEDAISQALWELVQEEEREKYGKDYIEPSSFNPSGNRGSEPSSSREGPAPGASPPLKKPKTTQSDTQPSVPSRPSLPTIELRPSDLSASSVPKRPISKRPHATSRPEPSSSSASIIDLDATSLKHNAKDESSTRMRVLKWVCPTCTCHNPETFLCCDACTTVRPDEESRKNIYVDVDRPKEVARKPPAAASPKIWVCHGCGSDVDDQWWTCPMCSTMKLKS